jgi:DNA-binding MarR family transcriptional regulator
VSRGIELWARERPDLDTSGAEIVGRLLRLGAIALDAIELTLAPHGLRARAYSVLAILRTHGAPEYEAPPRVLLDATFLTTGGLTNLLDRMEVAGLVARRPDPNDRRGILVRLTPHGVTLIDQVAAEVGRVERTLVADLTEEERGQLARLLSRLLTALDPIPISLR